MFITLATLFTLGGLGLLGVGAVGFVRRRWQRRASRLGAAAGPTWPYTATIVVGAGVLLVPDVLAGLLTGAVSEGGALGPWGSAGVVYRILVVLWLAVLVGGLFVTRNRVVDTVAGARDRALRAIHSRTDPELRAIRRTEIGRGMPRDLATLVRYEVSLGERLMHYQRDPEQAYDRPAMVDLTDPVTVTAWEAMFRAEALRPTAARPTGRDALASDYGRSVIALANAVVAAERHAVELVHSGITPDERAALHDADRVLEFVRRHATSAGERSAAYDELIARLQAVRSVAAPAPDATGAPADGERPSPQVQAAAEPRAHPWLEVTDRADAG